MALQEADSLEGAVRIDGSWEIRRKEWELPPLNFSGEGVISFVYHAVSYPSLEDTKKKPLVIVPCAWYNYGRI